MLPIVFSNWDLRILFGIVSKYIENDEIKIEILLFEYSLYRTIVFHNISIFEKYADKNIEFNSYFLNLNIPKKRMRKFWKELIEE